jgi:hypothetical protein
VTLKLYRDYFAKNYFPRKGIEGDQLEKLYLKGEEKRAAKLIEDATSKKQNDDSKLNGSNTNGQAHSAPIVVKREQNTADH